MGLSKRQMTLHQGEGHMPAKTTSLSEKLPNDVCGIAPTLLRKRATKEYMLHQLHLVRAAMKATLIDRGRDPPLPFIHCQRLMTN